MVKYNISHLADDEFVIQWEQPVPGLGAARCMSRFTYTGFDLKGLISIGRSRISSTLGNKASRDDRYRGTYQRNAYAWDTDVSKLPESFQRQRSILVQAEIQDEPERLFYIEFFSDGDFKGPRLRKLEKPLMTWQEACEALKTKVA